MSIRCIIYILYIYTLVSISCEFSLVLDCDRQHLVHCLLRQSCHLRPGAVENGLMSSAPPIAVDAKHRLIIRSLGEEYLKQPIKSHELLKGRARGLTPEYLQGEQRLGMGQICSVLWTGFEYCRGRSGSADDGFVLRLMSDTRTSAEVHE